MAKLFCISDVHSYFDEMKAALDEAGFDENNEDHWLINLGDSTDRGPKTQEVIDYLMNLPRCILVAGNHDSLLMQCIENGFAQSHDHHNGTFRSIIDLAPNAENFYDACAVAYVKVKPFVDKMIPYFETKRFVFCHGYLPVKCDDGLPMYYRRNRKFSKKEDWREAHASEWEQAMWLNGVEMVHNGFDIEKCVVVGHFHASWGRAQYDGKPEFGDGADFSPYYYEDKLIAIDACTHYSHKVNVLTIEDEFLEESCLN